MNRIEVMSPVYDNDLKADLMNTIELGMADTANGRIVDGHGLNEMQQGAYLRSQEEIRRQYVESCSTLPPDQCASTLQPKS